MEMKTQDFVRHLMIVILLGCILFDTWKIRKDTKEIKIQIDSLKKQDSIKELYRVYNIPTGADTLLKPISK
jgi:preprotein translocase subunit YajC